MFANPRTNSFDLSTDGVAITSFTAFREIAFAVIELGLAGRGEIIIDTGLKARAVLYNDDIGPVSILYKLLAGILACHTHQPPHTNVVVRLQI